MLVVVGGDKCTALVDRGQWVGQCEDVFGVVILVLLVVMSSTYYWLRVEKDIVVVQGGQQCENPDRQGEEALVYQGN